jgi:hypothetical protein
MARNLYPIAASNHYSDPTDHQHKNEEVREQHEETGFIKIGYDVAIDDHG